MKAAVYYGPHNIKIEDVKTPDIGPKDVLVEVKATGICGTDVHIFKEDLPFVKKPIIIGHESAGKVVKVGNAVKTLSEGDDVAIDSNFGCGECYFCKSGRKNLCDDVRIVGYTIDGTFAEYAKIPAEVAYKMPEGLSYEEASISEPLACVIHGSDVANIKPGDSVVILGAGPIGLLHIQVAQARGASKVMAVEKMEERLKLAEKFGAIPLVSKDLVKEVMEITNGLGVDVCIEAAGSPTLASLAMHMLKKGGKVVFFGAPPADVEIPFKPYDFYNKEIQFLGSWINPYTFERALNLIAYKKVKVKPIITHTFPLNKLVHAIEMLDKKAEGAIKIVITP